MSLARLTGIYSEGQLKTQSQSVIQINKERRTNMSNIMIKNDNTSKIIIKIDTKKINHKLLNQYIQELEQLNAKYHIEVKSNE